MPALLREKGKVGMFNTDMFDMSRETYDEREVAINRFEAAINVLVDLAAKGDTINVEWQARNIAKKVASGDFIPSNF